VERDFSSRLHTLTLQLRMKEQSEEYLLRYQKQNERLKKENSALQDEVALYKKESREHEQQMREYDRERVRLETKIQ